MAGKPGLTRATMTRLRLHPERHLASRIGCLRAAVLGANDGIVSTASLIIGVAAAGAKPANILRPRLIDDSVRSRLGACFPGRVDSAFD